MKTKIKLAADILMTAALPVLMCYSLITETAHEIVGLVMFALFILHHILNFGWTKALFKGKYPPKRIVGTVINALVLLCMIGLMYSSIVISKHIFTFLDLSGAGFARTVHLMCAYWGLALMSVHLGMHFRQMTAGIKPKKTVVIVLHIFFAMIALVGIYEFIALNFVGYMFGQVQFVFIDTSKSPIIAVLENLSVMVLFAEGGYWLNKALSRTNKENEKSSYCS
ncbi:MAG: DUF4405 domain-containing protein [Ruminiclostridium sp.]|nr:DUF4405 domain-containing protein [Ruminiclostridium sp.]